MKLRDWLAERQQNAVQIAATKRGADRDGWLEDADYFRRAVEAVEQQQVIVDAACGIRPLTSAEMADCCGGCRTNSAIETWMRRAIAKFCEVNGIQIAPGVPVVVAVNPSRDQGPCTVCGVPWAKHGTAPTCASHDYTPGVTGMDAQTFGAKTPMDSSHPDGVE